MHVKSAKDDLECELIGFIPDEGEGRLVSMRNFLLKFTELEGQPMQVGEFTIFNITDS